MHIMEGYLPVEHAASWGAVAAVFFANAVRKTTKLIRENRRILLLLGVSAGYCFVLSALKLPSVTGSCSHPTGIGLGTILFGPWIMVLIGTIVLLFQALLLAHGGLTTLGANSFSMAIVGAFVAWAVYKFGRKLRAPVSVAAFFAAALSDLITYVTTATQLALAYPDPSSGFWGSWAKFMGIFSITQIPLAVAEGLLTALVMLYLLKHQREELRELGLVTLSRGETA